MLQIRSILLGFRACQPDSLLVYYKMSKYIPTCPEMANVHRSKKKGSFRAIWILLVSAWRVNLEIFCSIHFAFLRHGFHLLRNRVEGCLWKRHFGVGSGALRSWNLQHSLSGCIRHRVNRRVNRGERNKICGWSPRCLRQNEISGSIQDLEVEILLACFQFYGPLLRRSVEHSNLCFCNIYWSRSYLVHLFAWVRFPDLENVNKPSILPKTSNH